MKKIVFCPSLILIGLCLFLAVTHRYTSIGLDSNCTGTRRVYFRVRWPGDGSFRLGYGHHAAQANHDGCFDLAAAIYQPRPDEVPDAPGLLRILTLHENEQFQRWLLMPGWLPPVFMLLALTGFRPKPTPKSSVQ